MRVSWRTAFCALAFSGHAFAQAHSASSWKNSETADTARLELSAISGGAPHLVATCQKAAPGVLISVYLGSEGAKKGTLADVFIVAGKVKKNFVGMFADNPAAGRVMPQVTSTMDDLKEVVVGGNTIRLSLNDEAVEVQAKGGADAVDAFELACSKPSSQILANPPARNGASPSSKGPPKATWTSEDAAVVLAALIGVETRCGFVPGKDFNVAAELRRHNVSPDDYKDSGRHAQLAAQKVVAINKWLNEKGKDIGCNEIFKILREKWPEALYGG